MGLIIGPLGLTDDDYVEEPEVGCRVTRESNRKSNITLPPPAGRGNEIEDCRYQHRPEGHRSVQFETALLEDLGHPLPDRIQNAIFLN